MPILSPQPGLQYDSVFVALHSAATRLGDTVPTLDPISGRVLGRSDAFMQQVTNDAWRGLCDWLGDKGYEGVTGDVVVSGLPVVAVADPAIFCWLSLSGFFDGATLWPQPALPTDFIHPLKVWERPSGLNANFYPMGMFLDGLPTTLKGLNNGLWEWRQDAIWILGSLRVMDFRIRYARYLGDFLDGAANRWFQQPILIVRAADALSWFISAQLEKVRDNGDPQRAADYLDMGQAAASLILNRDIRPKQRETLRRRSRSGRLEGGGGYG
jgi:hypothetical protein